MSDITLTYDQHGEPLIITLGGTTYTPEELRARLETDDTTRYLVRHAYACDRAWSIAHEQRGTAASKLGRIIEVLREVMK